MSEFRLGLNSTASVAPTELQDPAENHIHKTEELCDCDTNLVQAAWGHKMTPGSPNVHFRWSTALNRDHNSTRRPSERKEKNEICGRRGKKSEI